MKNATSLFVFMLVVMVLAACKKDNSTDKIDLGYNYFPTTVGSYIVYDVDSTFYNDFYNPTKVTNYKFQLKEKYESVFTDNQNRPTLRIERYVKPFDSIIPYADRPWQLRNVWMANKTISAAEKVEDNIRFVKLSFPVNVTQSWNGNAQNILAEQTYSYSFFDKARSIGNASFDSVLRVKQCDELYITEKHYQVEFYARNIGLIYKEWIDVNSQIVTNDPIVSTQFYAIPIMNRVVKGNKYTWVYNSRGVE
jgi:hypothetical protein